MQKLNSGRVVIPKNLRELYKMEEDTIVDIIDNGNGILIQASFKKYEIDENEMEELKNLYIMLKDSGLLDEHYTELLEKITNK